MKRQKSTQVFYDHVADTYKQISDHRCLYNSAVDNTIKMFRENQDSTSMLDIGSGNGLRAKKLSRTIGIEKLYLSDVSNKMVALCKQNVPESTTLDLKSSALDSIGEKFDMITLQWNVLGHVESFEKRVKLLKDCGKCLMSGGQIFLDVNNRHNSRYGKFRVFGRWVLDCVWPNYERGNTMISAQVNNQSVQGFGHLFTLAELKETVNASGLKISAIRFVDYDYGTIKKHFFQGQIFCVLETMEDYSV